MDCPNCATTNPDDNRYCGTCGTTLDPKAELVTRQVDRILQDRFKERALVEYEVTDQIVTRFGSYLKIAAWVFAPALLLCAIAIATAAFLGFKTYSNATESIQKAANLAVNDVQARAQKTTDDMDAMERKSNNKFGDVTAKSARLQGELVAEEKKVALERARVAGVVEMAEADESKLREIQKITK